EPRSRGEARAARGRLGACAPGRRAGRRGIRHRRQAPSRLRPAAGGVSRDGDAGAHVRRADRRARARAAESGRVMLDTLIAYPQAWLGPAWPAVWTLVKIIAIVAPLMICVAYLTLWERKLIGWIQVRIGPNRVTFFGIAWLGGLAQPIADGLKLLVKEIIVP